MSERRILQILGDGVLRRRRERNWTRRELAHRAGISERFLADVERGRANPSILRLAEIASALGTTPPALLQSTPRPDGRSVVALLGLRGAGKSSVGQRLADVLDCAFVELDQAVERHARLQLSEIFELHGEDYYRRLEREVLAAELDGAEQKILATGGGIVTDPENFGLLRGHAVTVWLQARPEDHWSRVVEQGDTRPMEGNEGAFAHLCAILSEREKLYRMADVQVVTSGQTLSKVVEEVRLALQARGVPGASGKESLR